jgi:hypothetical protein
MIATRGVNGCRWVIKKGHYWVIKNVKISRIDPSTSGVVGPRLPRLLRGQVLLCFGVVFLTILTFAFAISGMPREVPHATGGIETIELR